MYLMTSAFPSLPTTWGLSVSFFKCFLNEDLSIFFENISSALTCLFQESEEYPSYCEYEN